MVNLHKIARISVTRDIFTNASLGFVASDALFIILHQGDIWIALLIASFMTLSAYACYELSVSLTTFLYEHGRILD